MEAGGYVDPPLRTDLLTRINPLSKHSRRRRIMAMTRKKILILCWMAVLLALSVSWMPVIQAKRRPT